MKDYRLSEIRDICETMHNEFGEYACIYCENNGLGDFCTVEFVDSPTDWYVDVEPRDMIELPCKIEVNADPCKIEVNADPYKWQVIWRGSYRIHTCEFYTEAEADAFLAELKGDRK